MVCLYVYVCVGHMGEPRKKRPNKSRSCLVADSGGPKEPCIRLGRDREGASLGSCPSHGKALLVSAAKGIIQSLSRLQCFQLIDVPLHFSPVKISPLYRGLLLEFVDRFFPVRHHIGMLTMMRERRCRCMLCWVQPMLLLVCFSYFLSRSVFFNSLLIVSSLQYSDAVVWVTRCGVWLIKTNGTKISEIIPSGRPLITLTNYQNLAG